MKTTIKQLRQIIKEEVSGSLTSKNYEFALELWKEAKTGEYLDSLTLEENLCGVLDLEYEEIIDVDEKYDMLTQACTDVNDLYEKTATDIEGIPSTKGGESSKRRRDLYRVFRDKIDQIIKQLYQNLQKVVETEETEETEETGEAIRCPECKGTGHVIDAEHETCDACNGEGEMSLAQYKATFW